VFGPEGSILSTYDKIHMFDAVISHTVSFKESRSYQPGEQAKMAALGEINMGLSICYDVRFPALYHHYAQAGAHAIVVPAAFTRPTGEAHWETLLRARAIETGAYILAPAQGGVHEDGRETWGRTMIIDPWGEVIEKLDHDKPGMIMADIDMGKVAEARRRIPSLTHVREFTS
jgi:predicted amidohydrolase